MTMLKTITEKVLDNKRIDDDAGPFLFQHHDLLAIGELAALVNQRKNGNRVFFNVNRHITIPTSASTVVNSARSPVWQTSLALISTTWMRSETGRREALLRGQRKFTSLADCTLTSPSSFTWRCCGRFVRFRPALHIKAFTAVEIDYLAQLSDCSISETLSRLQEAGLGSLPGGGAEIFSEKVREQLCPEKISGQKWLSIMEEVHQAGLKSNATMLYGHLESFADRIDHMRRLRELQDRTGGFQVFIPLAFQPENSPLTITKSTGTSGVDDLKTLAIARIYLDNFANIKGYWVMLGEKIAQVALAFGVNDLDGTVVEEKIGHDAGAYVATGNEYATKSLP